MKIPNPPDGVGRVAIRIADVVPGVSCCDAALAFYHAGFRVIPGHPTEKRSAVRWDPWLPALSPEAISAHYAEHPDHTVCCILDERQLVLDADTPLAVTALDMLEQQRGVESNFVVNTRRGQHRYYRLAAGTFARTSTHGTEQFPERLDVKAARSLVVLPPSPNKTIANCAIETVDDLVEVGQDFVDAVFRHNGSEPPREHRSPQPVGDDDGRPAVTATVAELGAMLDQIDPDCGYDEWCRILMAVHHETGGSEEGFHLVNRWSFRGAKYCGERELRGKWRSFDGYTGTPITVGTIRHHLAQHGNGATADSEFEVCEYEVVDAAPAGSPAGSAVADLGAMPGSGGGDSPVNEEPNAPSAPELLLSEYSITRNLDKLKRELVEEQFLLDGIALIGQATVLYAAPNTGKTLLVIWMLLQAIRLRRVDPARIFYVNCDDTLPGLLQKGELAAAHGFHMLSDGYEGFETRNLQKILMEVISLGQARGSVIVLDTLKKFADLMDKRASTAFMKLMRKFVLRGGSVLMLAHANKKPGPDGKPVYAGVADILDDADCGYILWATSKIGDPETVVEFERKKGRGSVRQRAVFAYSAADGLSYQQLLASVRQVGDVEAGELEVAATIRADDELVATTKACIRQGVVMRMPLLAEIARRSKSGRRKAQEVLDRYSGTDLLQHHWTYDVQARGAKVYRLLEPIPEAEADGTPATDAGEEGGHE